MWSLFLSLSLVRLFFMYSSIMRYTFYIAIMCYRCNINWLYYYEIFHENSSVILYNAQNRLEYQNRLLQLSAQLDASIALFLTIWNHRISSEMTTIHNHRLTILANNAQFCEIIVIASISPSVKLQVAQIACVRVCVYRASGASLVSSHMKQRTG